MEAKYRGLLEAAPDAMVVVNQDGDIVLLNVRAEKQFGYLRDELIGQKVTNIVPEGFAEWLIADGTRSAAEALAQHIGTGIELSALRKDGSVFPIEIMLSPLESEAGILVAAAIRDISVRKAAAEQLIRTEAKYRGLLEAAPDAMVVVNESGEIHLLNVQAEKQFGYLRDELIGQPVTNIVPVGFAERLIADETRSAVEALSQHIGTGIELSARRKDGSVFPIEIMLSPLRSPEGLFVTAAIRDITLRRAAQQHLIRTEAKYRGLLEAAPDAIVVVNEAGDIVLLNARAEKQFGYLRDELIGQKVTNIVPEGFAERLIADGTRSSAEALAQHIGSGIELSARRKDGSEFPIEIMLSPLEGEEGILVTAAIRDVSVRKAALEHLARTEAKYRGLLEAAPDAMVVVNESGKIDLLNVQAERQFGYCRDELIGQPVTNIIPVGFAEWLIADGTRSAAEALAKHIGTGIEVSARRKDGSGFPIEIMLSPLASAEGNLVTAAIRDISLRRAAEEHSTRTEANYLGLLEAAPDAMVVVNEAGEIVLLNARVEKQFGYLRDELIGQKVTNIVPEAFAERPVADRTRSAAEAPAQHIGTGMELTARRKDGSEFPIEIVLSPLRSPEGTFVTAAIRDISDRKDAEERLARAKRDAEGSDLLAAIVTSSDDAIISKTLDGTITSWNPSAELMFGYSSSEAVGQNIRIIVPSDRLEEEDRFFDQIVDGKMIDHYETERVTKDGRRAEVSISISPLRDKAGRVVGAAKVAREISVRKQKDAELLAAREVLASQRAALERSNADLIISRDRAEQASAAKSRFLTGITHELRTPLHGMLGYSELLHMEGGLNHTQSERVATITAAGEHLLALINDVLDVSQIEAGRLELHPVEIDLSDFVRACIDVVRPSAIAKGLTLNLTGEKRLALFADETRLRQVLINLLGNAIKFTPSGVVELRTAKVDSSEWIRVEVADTGPGIPAMHHGKLFQTFERLNANSVVGIEGAGLGLSLAARLVRMMGGRIGYLDNPGGGSLFWLELPAGRAGAANGSPSAIVREATRRRLRVLVVDDNALNRAVAMGFLSFGGHEVVCLDNGAAAVATAASEDLDLILMDVRMPGMDGLEATRLIRALPGPRGTVPVMAVTAQAYAEQIEICRRAGMTSHISKPFKREALLAAVERAVLEPKGTAHAAVPRTSAPADPHPSVFDRTTYEDTIGCLPPEHVVDHLRMVIARCETLLAGLRAPDMFGCAGELAELAHGVVGGAGILGLLSLARSGSRFERAADSDSSDMAIGTIELAEVLANDAEIAVQILRRELAEIAAVADLPMSRAP